MKALIDISDKDLEILTFQPLKPLPKVNVENLIRILQQGVIIPDNATNGDIIKTMFPNCKVGEPMYNNTIEVEFFDELPLSPFWLDWWNGPYNTESDEV